MDVLAGNCHSIGGTLGVAEASERMTAGGFYRYKYYLRRRPTLIALLSLLAILGFVLVTGLSQAYHSQRQALGSRWFGRGVGDLRARHFEAAVTEFRSALLYSRDDYSYQLNLAQALIGLGHSGEASAYLMNLWEREPEDGVVNLALARIAAQRGLTDQAVRHYHDAVYAAWTPEEEANRDEARLELIRLLLRTDAKARAQAELVALAENVSDDPAEQQEIGDLFSEAQDYEHALAAYRVALKADRHSESGLAGAGAAAFQLGRYAVAEPYLQAAVMGDANNQTSAELLKTTEEVLRLDPYRMDLSVVQRNRIVVEALAAAGRRLEDCPSEAAAPASSDPEPSLAEVGTKLRSEITESGLARAPGLAGTAMDWVFRVERQTNAACGMPGGETDRALLLIGKMHEGS
jgi:tetratricopeptide (TPR) repeat protein